MYHYNEIEMAGQNEMNHKIIYLFYVKTWNAREIVAVQL